MMSTLPITVLACLTVVLGLVLGMLWISGRTLPGNRKAYIVGAHIIVGVAILEQMVALLQSLSPEQIARTGNFATIAGALFALAMFLGLAAGVIGLRRPNATSVVIATHATVGLAGFLILLSFVNQL